MMSLKRERMGSCWALGQSQRPGSPFSSDGPMKPIMLVIRKCKHPECTVQCKHPECTGQCKHPECTGQCKHPECTDQCKHPECTGQCKHPECTGQCKHPECRKCGRGYRTGSQRGFFQGLLGCLGPSWVKPQLRELKQQVITSDDWEIPFENTDLQWLGSGHREPVFLGKLCSEEVAGKEAGPGRQRDRHTQP
ncbi:hypothetical protein Btru_074813 [Bulinus truncatus]|nr:hypothetical protein Btru_074813 [Bulinus truncatus]